jgi:hypothetical protein
MKPMALSAILVAVAALGCEEAPGDYCRYDDGIRVVTQSHEYICRDSRVVPIHDDILRRLTVLEAKP